MAFFAILTSGDELSQSKVSGFMTLVEKLVSSVGLEAEVLKEGSGVEGSSFALMSDINVSSCVDLCTSLETKSWRAGVGEADPRCGRVVSSSSAACGRTEKTWES